MAGERTELDVAYFMYLVGVIAVHRIYITKERNGLGYVSSHLGPGPEFAGQQTQTYRVRCEAMGRVMTWSKQLLRSR